MESGKNETTEKKPYVNEKAAAQEEKRKLECDVCRYNLDMEMENK
jgi:hypothetical protein